ncbi:MAG: N-acetylglucosamine-6-phosphate deacetylase [Anaerolineales bacterium]|nr:N-acetylglucosamine-6-phosphate deacetylase [Anaerolineales bacterium]
MTTLFTNMTLLTPGEELAEAAVMVSGETIAYAGPAALAPETEGERIDLGGRFLAPGLIDVHVHGGNGMTFGAGEDLGEKLDLYSHWAAARGVSGFLCSVSLPDHARYLQVCRAYADIFDAGVGGAEALGLHLEGPYLNVAKKGTFPEPWLRMPSTKEMGELLEASRGWMKQISIAPELPGAEEIAAMCNAAGVAVALGHSNASYEIATEALSGHWGNVTHTYNAQSGLHHREPGVVGAVLHSKDCFAELIADGVHVHPAAMRLLVERLGTDRVILITDATLGAGLPDGEHDLLDIHIIVKDGIARIPAGNLAGSTIDLNRCVGNACRLLGVPMAEAVRMASTNPARMIGVDGRLGRVHAGMDASLVALDEEANVALTMVRGKVVYQTEMRSQRRRSPQR